MAQDEIYIKQLILAAMDENNQLKKSRILLEIALEQLALKDSPQTLERIEVLLDEYVNSYNCHFEELEAILGRLRNASLAANKSCTCKLK